MYLEVGDTGPESGQFALLFQFDISAISIHFVNWCTSVRDSSKVRRLSENRSIL